MQDLLSGYELVAGTFLPLLIAVFIREEWKKELKVAVSFLFVLAASFGHLFYSGEWSVQNLGASILAILILTVTTYKGFWQGTGLTDLIEKNVLAGKSGSTLVAYLIVGALLFGGATMQGCVTTGAVQQGVEETAEAKVFKALEFSATAYDSAMRGLRDLYVNGMISTESAQKAWDAGEAFYLAQKGAVEALRVYMHGKTAGTQAELDAAVLKAGTALAQFTALVTPFLMRRLVDDLDAAGAALKGGK